MSTVTLDNKTILVTGAAGFIGSNLVKRIYQEAPSATVIGIDNMNAYYDVALKEFRLNELAKYPTFTFVKGNIADKELITELFEKYKPSVVVNLAAQAGVRYSITNPDAYVESNLVGFFNILELFKGLKVEKVVVPLPEEDQICPVCGTQMVLIGEEYVRRELEFIPATCKVIEYYSQSYGCPSCKEGPGDTEKPVIVKSQVPPALLEHLRIS